VDILERVKYYLIIDKISFINIKYSWVLKITFFKFDVFYALKFLMLTSNIKKQLKKKILIIIDKL
jgi:hypothetical protein